MDRRVDINLNNNPFLQCLEEANVLLTIYEPPFNESERQIPNHLRMHCAERISDLFIPFNSYQLLEESLRTIIYKGYSHRNPLDLDYICRTRQKNLLNSRSIFNFGGSLIGLEGTGKRTAISRILSTKYKQTYEHVNKERRFIIEQVLWILIDCPVETPTRMICLHILHDIDRVLGTSYSELFYWQKEDELLAQVAKILWLHGVGLLIINNIQVLLASNEKIIKSFFEYLSQISDCVGIPVIVIGVPEVESMLPDKYKRNTFIWHSLDFDSEWDLLVKKLLRYQWTPQIAEVGDVSFELFSNSSGIIDVAIRIYISCQQHCIKYNLPKIDSNIIRAIAELEYSLNRGL